MQVECAPYYELPDRAAGARYCYQGRWNLPPPQCIPGQPIINIQININIFPNCTHNCATNSQRKPNVSKSKEYDSLIFIEDQNR